jgi:putative membrane protein
MLRDHLANERTLLAWVRTAVALMGMGFVVAKFSILLHSLGSRHVHVLTQAMGNVVGILLVLSGILTAGFAIVNFNRVRRGIDVNEVRFSPVLAIVAALMVMIVSVLLTIYLVVTG